MRVLAIFFMMSISLAAHSVEFKAGPSGGVGGTAFADNPPSNFMQLNSIKICSGSVIDSIQTTYTDASGRVFNYGKHGGNGGSCNTFYFWAGEYITTLTGKYGSKVDSLAFSTNFGRVLSKGGAGGRKVYKYTANDQFSIAGFMGASGSLIDAIGVVYVKRY